MAAERRDVVVAVAAVEAIALGTALAIPVTPSKTGSGSTWTPAELFVAEPSYLQEVLASFVAAHVLFAVVAVVGWVYVATRRGR